jgi:hypothetical protein
MASQRVTVCGVLAVLLVQVTMSPTVDDGGVGS